MADASLHRLKPGQRTKIVAFASDTPDVLRGRLCALGFVPGSVVEVIRRAPLGDPTEYEVRGARVSLRRSEARLLLTEAS